MPFGSRKSFGDASTLKAVRGAPVTKTSITIAIALSGIALGAFHYELKPKPTQRDLQNVAQGMASRITWRGQIAPDIEVKTTRGDTFQLSDNVGKKIIVLNFFATWCQPCREEMPELNRYFNDHKSESFVLVGIDSEENPNTVAGFLSELKVDFPVGIDAGPIRQQYGVTSLPTTVLIGVDGKVQFYEEGALANADVAFDALLQKNLQLIKANEVIAVETYRLLAKQQPSLPVIKKEANTSSEQDKLDPRAKDIAARMDCTCGCDKKVQICTCNASTKIKHALATEAIDGKSDTEVMRSLNKRFCMEAM
ncbi:MAG TPA: TlpA disulfide reductase family protein [Chthoniobacterales bacterium]|nr:TlpA disulfide reductase family protein [Chthoniobacterales bacterium]